VIVKIVILLFVHWIGDYVLQTNEMAANKANGVRWLSIHVAVYAAVLLCFGLVFFRLPTAFYFVLANAGFHWVTDFLTSRTASKYKNQPRIYFPIIGLDQFIHAATLILMLDYFSA